MKKLFYIFTFLLLSSAAFAQSSGKWIWAINDTVAHESSNPGGFHDFVVAGSNKLLWGYPIGKKLLYGSDVMTDYQITVFGAAGHGFTTKRHRDLASLERVVELSLV